MKKPVRENMSFDLITIGWNEKVETAYRRMKDQRLRHLPVCDEVGQIIGMLSDRDVQRAMISVIERGSSAGISSESVEFDQDARVRDYMNWPVKTVSQYTDVREVAECMISEKISALLISDSSGRSVGIATTEDLLKLLVELLSQPGTPVKWNLEKLLERPSSLLANTVV